MIVLGIDPGMAILGYGVVEQCGSSLKPIDYGVVTTPPDMMTAQRLTVIFEAVGQLIDRYCPESIAVEELFFNKNAKTALSIGHARGVAILAAALKSVEVYEYTPLQVKQAVVGYGRASKQQVQQMVRMLLGLKEIPKPDDAADALAVSICHLHSIALQKKLQHETGSAIFRY
ncbi:MAG: crossover junction endodeoxyribonuclease RuvC [Clostridiales bacterium]|jgi:crossover junction endodeoxyribonuclease RuvC|nr:crossover junction endodeoxyribonuclease RuvC [Clostridiales bacterium]